MADRWEERVRIRARAEKAEAFAPGAAFIPVNARTLINIIDRGSDAATAVAELRSQRNAARNDATLLAKMITDYGNIAAIAWENVALVERYYCRSKEEE